MAGKDKVPTVESLSQYHLYADESIEDVIHNLNGFMRDVVIILESYLNHEHGVSDE